MTQQTNATEVLPYRVEIDTPECEKCHRAATFNVIGPDDIAEGITFGDECDAEEYAGALNHAYEKRRTANASDAAVDPHVEANVDELRKRAKAGMSKYGVNLTRDDLGRVEWFQHLIEELLDAANYARTLQAAERVRVSGEKAA